MIKLLLIIFLTSIPLGSLAKIVGPLNDLFGDEKGFSTTNAIQSYCRLKKVPVNIVEAATEDASYCIVMAHPYSGVQIVHLFCFLRIDGQWGLFLSADLWETSLASLKIKPNGKHVDVFDKGGELILKIRSPAAGGRRP